MTGSDTDQFDPHALDEQDFLDEVLSFEFWLGAVDGYVTDRPYGRRPGTEDVELDEARRDRLITTLCNYCAGERIALDGASRLVTLAPNLNSRIFMATQTVDEARHLEVFIHRLTELGVTAPETEIARRTNPALEDFGRSLQSLIDDGDWVSAVFAQNVILETMEFTVFRNHALDADPVTADVLEGVIADERRHFGFGESDLGRMLRDDPSQRGRLGRIRQDLDAMVLQVFAGALDDLGVLPADRPDIGRDYLHTIERLGLTA